MGPFVGEMTIMKVGGGEAVGEDDYEGDGDAQFICIHIYNLCSIMYYK